MGGCGHAVFNITHMLAQCAPLIQAGSRGVKWL